MKKLEIKANLNGRNYNSADVALSDLHKLNGDRLKALSELKTPLTQASIYLDRWVQSNFKTEGGKVGGWKPFKAGGRVTKDGVDTTAVLLQLTGRLRASFTPFATSKTAGIGSDLLYSKNHDEGIDVPKRQILPERKDVMADVRKILRNHVVKSISLRK